MSEYPFYQKPANIPVDLEKAKAISRALLDSGQIMAFEQGTTLKQTALLGEWEGRKIIVVQQMIPTYSGELQQWIDVSAYGTVALDAQTLDPLPEYVVQEVPNA